MKDKNLLGLFAKFPEPGKVKTRLARDIGPDAAARACREIAEYVLQRTSPADSGYRRIIFFAPQAMRQRFSEWMPGEVLMAQRGGDVGERMDNALKDLFGRGAEKAVVVGSDIPGLHRGIIGKAFQELDDCDVVIGPAMDGGYYLIGMKFPHPEIFRNITWGTEKVFEETVTSIEKTGLTHCLVTTLFDVDDLDDLVRAEELLKDAEDECG
ncbi:MAG: TIGR04282 family arsenosugar biosynthesis glycosyltransferase [Nitrospirota bacterium]|nr:TIGR04282 family arsenosugar biosynthesis glycosyltransferase [Nitrospirota bacterium]